MGLIRKQAGFDLRTKVQKWLDEFKKERGWTERMPKHLMTVGDNDTIWINEWHNYVLMELFYYRKPPYIYRNIPPYICFEFRELGEPLPDGWIADMGDCHSTSKEKAILEFLNSTEFRYLHRVRVIMPGTRMEFFGKIDSLWQIENKYYGTNK